MDSIIKSSLVSGVNPGGCSTPRGGLFTVGGICQCLGDDGKVPYKYRGALAPDKKADENVEEGIPREADKAAQC